LQLVFPEQLMIRKAAPKLPAPCAEFVAWRREHLAELRSWLAGCDRNKLH